MEGAKGYLRSKGYQRLNGSRRKIKLQTAVIINFRRRRLKLVPARSKLLSAKKLLIGWRDAYVDMMMNIATKRMIGTLFGGDLISRFGMKTAKEYDKRMIVESTNLL